MKLKSTLILFLLTALIAGGYFFAQKHLPSTEDAAERSKRVLDLKASDVTEVEIKGVDRDFFFEKKDEKWSFKRPIQVRANISEIEGLLATIEYLESRRSLSLKEITDAKLSFADYGLDKPRLTAILKTKSGTTTLYLGNEAKQGDGLYIQIGGNPKVFLVEKDLAVRLGKKLEEYRERTLFDFLVSHVKQVELKNASKLLEFSKTNQLWRIVQPLNARADSSKIDEFLQQTSNLHAQDFLSDDPTAAKEYSLEDPAQEVTISLDQKDSVSTLLLGQKLKNDDKKIAAKIKGQNSIVSIEATYAVEVAKPLNDFRDRNLAVFKTNDITEIELKIRQVPVLLQREGDVWRIFQPEKMEADKELVEKFLMRLNSMQIKEFTTDVITDLDKFGLKTPLFTITLRGKSEENDSTKANSPSVVYLNLAIGKEGPVQKLAYVRVGDEPSVYGVDLFEVEGLPRSELSLRTRLLFEIKKDTLKSCSQKKGRNPITLEHMKDGKWKVAEISQGIINETSWQKFLNNLNHFAVEKIVGPALNTTIAQYGLAEPEVSYVMTTEIAGKLVTEEILVGHETPQRKYYILWKNQLLICEVNREIHQILTADWFFKTVTK